MVELKKWRLRLDDNGDFIIHGLARYGVVMSKPATKKNIQRIALETSFLQVHINNSIYRLWFRDADLSKPITPMRVMKRQPGESCLDAVYLESVNILSIEGGSNAEHEPEMENTGADSAEEASENNEINLETSSVDGSADSDAENTEEILEGALEHSEETDSSDDESDEAEGLEHTDEDSPVTEEEEDGEDTGLSDESE